MRGQTLVLGCLVMLVLAISVITTVNIGRAVHERIALQNTADASAYSMAAMEARAFNFYAFANRTQVSHYVSAMTWQSILSFTYFSEAFLVDTYGVMLTLDKCAQPSGGWRLVCPAIEALPYVGPFIRTISQVIDRLGQFLVVLLDALARANPDQLVGRIVIPALRRLNDGLAAASEAALASTLAQLHSSAGSVLRENDSGADVTSGAALSACLFERVHMREALRRLDPTEIRDSSKVSRAKRVMGAISNASRWDGFVTDREDVLPMPQWFSGMREVLRAMPQWKWGQTKMLSHGFARGRPWGAQANLIRDWWDPPNAPTSMMAQGDDLGSDDLYQIKLGPPSFGPVRNPFSCGADDDPMSCWGDPAYGRAESAADKNPFRYMLKTSIWAFNDAEGIRGGLHYRLARAGQPLGPGWAPPRGTSGFLARLGLSRYDKAVVPGVTVAIYVANVRGIADGNHPWEGVAPFPHFEPGQFEGSCGGAPLSNRSAPRAQEFNQPSAWVGLNKSPAKMGMALPAPEFRFQFAQGQTLTLADRRPGLNALSRAQAYYHRPGNWAEMPNFFNPYWRPRLASVWQGRYSNPLVEATAAQLAIPPRKLVLH